MAYDKLLANRVRETLSGRRRVEEKKMFRGIAFLVNGKMCVSVSRDNLLCRIGPGKHEEAVAKRGCSPMKMRGRELVGWVYVDHDSIRTKKELEYWVGLCLDFNKHSKASKKKPKRKGAK